MEEATPILQVRELTTRLRLGGEDVTVVDRVNFDLYPGQTLAVVGESGCGKSMMALSLMRILPEPPALAPEGEVLYRGRNLLELSDREMRGLRGKRIAMIFQDPMTALNPVYSVGNQLHEVISLHLGIHGEEADERIVRVLEEVQIPQPRQRMLEYPHQLSGGMKQRVMIAMAMLCEPDILIADEPTTALDVTIQAQVLDLMRKLQSDHGTAIVLITHDMGVVAEMADDVLVMYASQVVEHAPVSALFDCQSHPYTEGLFASLPGRSSAAGSLKAIDGSVPSVGRFPSGCFFHPRCPYAMERCKQGNVATFKYGEHHVRCWLSEEELRRCPSLSSQ